MTIVDPQPPNDDLAAQWDARVASNLERLPAKAQRGLRWLLAPSRRLIRHVAGIALVLGGIFSILPILGLWMLPLGLALLSEDHPASKAYLERAARWIEGIVQRFRRRRNPP